MNSLTLGRILAFAIFTVAVGLPAAIGAVAHVHEHQPGQRERTDDGAFAPRDAAHFGADGEHKADFDHEAILGSAKTAKEFDELPPEEAKTRLRELAKTMDKNKDGGVSTVMWSNFERRDPKVGVFLKSTEATPCGHFFK